MLLPRLAALLPMLSGALAFKNSSPFLMLSNQALDKVMFPAEVQPADAVEAAISKHYKTTDVCKEGRHVLVSQPGLTTTDLESMPKLRAIANSADLPWQLTIPNVLGELDSESVRHHMQTACGRSRVIKEDSRLADTDKRKNLPLWDYRGATLPEDTKKRQKALAELDGRLDTLLSGYPASEPYTIVLVSKPASRLDDESRHYEMEDKYQGVLHQDLKRDTEAHVRASNSSKTPSDDFQDGLPLFERYAYFSPALFMGLTVSILLFVILYVGVSAIAGLQVSYGAFSKEMAPQNQKKQQ